MNVSSLPAEVARRRAHHCESNWLCIISVSSSSVGDRSRRRLPTYFFSAPVQDANDDAQERPRLLGLLV